MKKLVILDFDGTIYNGDSLLHFARFLNPLKYFGSLFLIAFPMVFSKLGLLSADRVKVLFFRIHLKGLSEQQLKEKGIAFFEKHRHRLYPKAIQFIRKEQEDESRCVVVSASCVAWLQPFCDFLKTELVCTQLETDSGGNYTGNIKGENVKGKAKIKALKQVINMADYDSVSAFGNSTEDRVLATISQQYYHCFFE